LDKVEGQSNFITDYTEACRKLGIKYRETDTLWCKMYTGNPFDIFIFPRLRDKNKPIYHPIIENT